MFQRITFALFAQAAFLLAVDVTGTWKLNTAKSILQRLTCSQGTYRHLHSRAYRLAL